MNKNLPEIVLPASMAVVALLISGLLLVATGLLDEYAGTVPLAPEPISNCTLTYPATRNPPQLTGQAAINFVSGEALFKANCAQCHAINDVVVGPALAGIRQRRPEKWLHAWVRNSSKLVASGDGYAVKIFEQYQKQQMPSFQLSNKEISQIFDYMEAVEGQGRVVAAN